jgi:hypothetical protein
MSRITSLANLKEITAYKKKLNWGEVPAIYHMASSSLSDVDGILTHGFDSAYKTLFNKSNWNLDLLGGYKDEQGNLLVERKPKISLRHVFDEQHYELHCYPIVKGERLVGALAEHALCPFNIWRPETMQMLFRISSLVAFIIYTFKNGDKADLLLIKYAHRRVEELILELRKSFDITEIKGYSIAEFCKEIYRRRPNFDLDDLLDTPNEETGT